MANIRRCPVCSVLLVVDGHVECPVCRTICTKLNTKAAPSNRDNIMLAMNVSLHTSYNGGMIDSDIDSMIGNTPSFKYISE